MACVFFGFIAKPWTGNHWNPFLTLSNGSLDMDQARGILHGCNVLHAKQDVEVGAARPVPPIQPRIQFRCQIEHVAEVIISHVRRPVENLLNVDVDQFIGGKRLEACKHGIRRHTWFGQRGLIATPA